MTAKQRMRFEIKEVTTEGTFEGLLSPYGNVDLGGDVVDPGAYTKTLADNGDKVPMLWQHKTDSPIGELTLEDRPEGLWAKGQLLMALPDAQKAYLLIKHRIIKGLSIGFDSVKDSMVNGIRHLKEIRLWEGSIVTFGMNLSAQIASVKADRETKDDFNEELAEVQLSDANYQMQRALCNALSSLTWASDLTRDEKVSSSALIIQQFAEAWAEYFPQYLDMLAEMYGGMELMARKRTERKAGAVFSAASKSKLKSAHGSITDAADILFALLDDEAGADEDTTSKAKAAADKTEPVNHSAAAQIQQLKEIATWNSPSN